ncbi:MAG TPA: ribonuclease P protein component [Opitutus sp.]|nr:ribonuclease P protein component [Opitutus sp.]
MRFRPEQHLRRQSDFRAIREHGRRIHCGAFMLWWLPRAQTSGAPDPLRRVGVVASTASVGHAVLRNRAKRRLREVFRRHQEHAPAGCDLLLTARSNAVETPFPELEKKFVDACAKIAPERAR